MDALSAWDGTASATPSAGPSGSLGTPSEILDGLRRTESGGNPYAVNKETKAMGPYQFLPDTVAMLHKQGIKFNPFDEQESRRAADLYLQQLRQKNGGDLNAALAQYGGFKTKDPSGYVAKVTAGANASPPVASNQDDYLNKWDSAATPGTVHLPVTGSLIDQIPGMPPRPTAQPSKDDWRDKYITGPLEAATAVGTGMIAAPIANIAGTIASAFNGKAPEANAEKLTSAITYQPRTQSGGDIVGKVGEVFDASKLGGLGPSEAVMLSDLAASRVPFRKMVTGSTKPQVAEVPAAEVGARPMVGGGSATAKSNPYPILTGEEEARGPFPVVKLSKTPQNVPLSEQQARAAIASDILGPDVNKIREGVITGNESTLRNEQALARAPIPTPAGELLKEHIANEQQALSNFAAQRIEATGANTRFANDYQRGEFTNNVIAGPDGVKGFIQGAKKAIYDQAMQDTAGRPVQFSDFDKLLTDRKFQAEMQIAGQKDFTGGLAGLVDVFKTEGFEGAPANSIAAAEKLRQALNRQWTPQNKYFIGRSIEALDNDVAAAGGPGLLEKGRALHQAEKTIFGAPGIKNLFGDLDPNGIQTATAFERIPQKLNDMPFDQWRHVYDTVDGLSRGQFPGNPGIGIPKELQMAAGKVKAEIAGSLAREVHQAGAKNVGTWNANAANKAMNELSMKIDVAFPPDEQAAFHTLNYGGQIMPGAHAYEGAGMQASRMGNLGLLEKHAPSAGAVLGGLTPIPGAPWVGAKAGEWLGLKSKSSRLAKERVTLDQQMTNNAKLGQTGSNALKNIK